MRVRPVLRNWRLGAAFCSVHDALFGRAIPRRERDGGGTLDPSELKSPPDEGLVGTGRLGAILQ
ncbi:MAG TPA: hypothetical protein DEV93_17245 [Chloroflexi bacterium]|nr:hypothetical protein [Chloroflexota bacterium]